MTDKQQINQWIEAGADLNKGLRLFIKLRSKVLAGRIVRVNPEANRNIAVRALLREAGVESDRVVILKTKPPKQPVTIEAQRTDAPKFRDMFPFLNEPNTPVELKILAADKITAYRKSIEAHRRLTDCRTVEECYLTAKEVVENYLENDLITREFKYYMEMGKVMGKHSIFDIYKELQVIRCKSAKEIFHDRTRLINRINRIKFEIKKGDKPHKLTERELSLRKNEHLLAEINRIIDGL